MMANNSLNMDLLIKGIIDNSNVRFCYADVTASAKTLEARHLSGPTAAKVLAEGLVSTALMSADSASPEETILLQIMFNGPLQGMVVEAADNGDLRGYTYKKVLNEFDGEKTIIVEIALGTQSDIQIMKSIPGKILNQARLKCDPPVIKHAVAKYYNQSLQVPAGIEIMVRSGSNGIEAARGIVVEKMPDGDRDVFIRVLERFNDCRTYKALRNMPDSAEPDLQALIGEEKLSIQATKPLKFGCKCSREKTEQVIAALPKEDIRQMIEENKQHSITCHFCGAAYSISNDYLRSLL